MKFYSILLRDGESRNLTEIVRDELSADVEMNDSLAEKLIRQGSVWRNKRRVKDPGLIFSGGEVEIYYPHKPIEEYSLDPSFIRYEDEHLLMVFKEGGVPSCPSPFSDYNCLTWGVQKYLAKQNNPYFVHAVHRLDKPAQGLIFFAKHKEAELKLHRMFYQRRVKKLYLAVTKRVENPPERLLIKDQLEWRGKIQEARSFIRYQKDQGDRSFFTASPLTGRPHQLRKHFAGYISPVIGDAQYGPYTEHDELLLISFHYRFRHPFTQKRMVIEYLPERFSCR